MKKILNMKISIIIVLTVTIVLMGIGFIVLSIELKSEKKKVNRFDVSFTDIKKVSAIKGGEVSPTGKVKITNNNKEIAMNFTFNTIHDELSYIATIKNNGTMPAEIIDIIESPDYNSKNFKNLIKPVTITLSDVEGKIIPAGGEMEMKVIVYYNPSQDVVGKKNIDYTIGLVTKSIE